jgi:hypothetical protein
MTRIRIATATAALTLGAGLVAAAPPATAVGTLVLTGSRTAYVDVTFPSPPQLGAAEYDTRGRYAGYYIEPLFDTGQSRSLVDGFRGGEVRFTGLSAGGRVPAVRLGRGPGNMKDEPTGRYRVYLIADGPATVTIPLMSGSRSYHLKPRKAVSSYARVAALRPGESVAGRLALTTGRRSVTVSALMVQAPVAAAADNQVCVAPAGRGCADARTDFGESQQFVNDPEPEDDRVLEHAVALDAPAGRYAAVHGAQHPLGVTKATGAAFRLTLA